MLRQLPTLATGVHFLLPEDVAVMAPNPGSPFRKVLTTLGSVKTGVFLLIIIGIVSAAGTFVLQRPVTEPEELAALLS